MRSPRNAEELADDGNGQGKGQVGHHVHHAAASAVLGQGVEQGVAQRFHVGAQLLHRVGRERPGDEAAQAGVVGWIQGEHRLPAPEVVEELLHFAFPHGGAGHGLEARPGQLVLPRRLPEVRDPQHPLAVLVAGDDPVAESGAQHRRVLAQTCIVGVRVGAPLGGEQEGDQFGVDVERLALPGEGAAGVLGRHPRRGHWILRS